MNITYKSNTDNSRGKRSDTIKLFHSTFTGYLCALLNDFILISYRVYMDFIWSSYSFHIAFIYLSYRNSLKIAFSRSSSLTEFEKWLGNPRYTGKSPPRCKVLQE